ncbi:MAG: 4'-phosphopantetheinyl transferase superfamily protein [Muribaculaceae bacterium]|nr:4'-phosphopantetheinyl transferase superfamily protein [Muribaculaceae bacterium]MDE6321378.1 4'-phosphopantetheinyl transferase superfamily protein [Muribaculaceae bacterium]
MDPILLTAPIEPHPGESRRDAERRTVASLLSAHYGHPVTVEHDDIGAPRIARCRDYISISHCRDMAVVAIANEPIGVDVETWREQLPRIADKFLTQAEQQAIGTDHELLLRAWTTKEAVYKLYHRPGTPLRDIPLSSTSLLITHPISSPDRVVTLAQYAQEP